MQMIRMTVLFLEERLQPRSVEYYRALSAQSVRVSAGQSVQSRLVPRSVGQDRDVATAYRFQNSPSRAPQERFVAGGPPETEAVPCGGLHGGRHRVERGEVPYFFFSSRRRHTRFDCDWSSDVCSSD